MDIVAGKIWAANWLDPTMGIVGAALVARWSLALIRDSSAVLLDHQVAMDREEALVSAIERDTSDRVADVHFWSIGHRIYAAELMIVSDDPVEPAFYKSLIPDSLNIVHVTVEVNRCAAH